MHRTAAQVYPISADPDPPTRPRLPLPLRLPPLLAPGLVLSPSFGANSRGSGSGDLHSSSCLEADRAARSRGSLPGTTPPVSRMLHVAHDSSLSAYRGMGSAGPKKGSSPAAHRRTASTSLAAYDTVTLGSDGAADLAPSKSHAARSKSRSTRKDNPRRSRAWAFRGSIEITRVKSAAAALCLASTCRHLALS